MQVNMNVFLPSKYTEHGENLETWAVNTVVFTAQVIRFKRQHLNEVMK